MNLLINYDLKAMTILNNKQNHTQLIIVYKFHNLHPVNEKLLFFDIHKQKVDHDNNSHTTRIPQILPYNVNEIC